MTNPRFHNLSDAELADQFGETAEAAQRHKALRKEVLDRGLSSVRGSEFEVMVAEKTRAGFDYDRCRELLGEQTYKALWGPQSSTWVTAKRRASSSAPKLRQANDGAPWRTAAQ